MNNSSSPKKIFNIIRLTALIVGTFFVAVSFFAEELKLDSQSGWGTGEILLAVFGLLMIASALLGKRLFSVYKSLAVILLNTIILFFVIEILSLCFLNLFVQEDNETQSIFMDYYDKQEWSKEYWKEHFESSGKKYVPFVEWKRKPFSGKYIHINEEGIRRTTKYGCSADSMKIFLFGGSTIGGWGAPDSLTIPSLFAKKLYEKKQKGACVFNYGEDSYNLFQNIIDLVIQLQKGNIPDKIIFLTGANEIINSYVTGDYTQHLFVSDFKEKLETFNILLSLIKGTNTFKLIKLFESDEVERSEHEINELAVGIHESFLKNYMVIDALAEKYNFTYDFFIQPVLPVSKKRLTEWEQNIDNDSRLSLKKYFQKFYSSMQSETNNYKNIYYIADIFDSFSYSVFIDIMHITPAGNEFIADKMVEKIF
jgi:lysophospholipase L1-like esterase